MKESATMGEGKFGGWLLAGLGTLSLMAVLGPTLVVYSTPLNPGLPILLGASATVVWGLVKLVSGEGRYAHWGGLVATGLLAWMGLSALFGLDVYLAQRSLATFVGGFFFVLVPQCALVRGRHWHLCANSYVVLSTVLCLAAWYIAWTESVVTGKIPPLMATFNNPDVFAILPMLSVLLALGLTERASTGWRWVLFASIGIGSLSILASGCRAALLGLAVGGGVFVGVLAYRRQSALVKSKGLLVVPFVILLLALPFSNFGLEVKGKLGVDYLTSDIGGDGTRYEVFWYGPLAVLRNPVLGAGPGCFGLSFQSVRPEGHGQLYIDTAHNDLMEMAVEVGVPGFLLWVLLLAAALVNPYTLVEKGRRPRAAAAVCGAVVAGVTFSCFNFIVSERPALWALCWIIGLALSFPTTRSTWREPSIARFGSAGLVVLLGLWAMHFGYRSMMAERYHQEARAYAEGLRTREALSAMAQALEYQPAAVQLLRKEAKLRKTLAGYRDSKRQLEKAEESLAVAHQFSSRDVLVLLELADIQASRGHAQQARESLELARDVAPYHHLVLRRLAALAIKEKRYRDAAELVAMESTGYGKRRAVFLSSLVHALEIESSGEGKELLEKWVDSAQNRGWELETLKLAIEKAAKAKHWRVARSFAELRLKESGEELCAEVLIAGFAAEEKGLEEGWRLLEESFEKSEPSRSQCFSELLVAWASVGQRLGKSEEVRKRLSLILERDKRNLQARLLLARSLGSNKQGREAIALVRAGLELHERSVELNRCLAELYERTGVFDLAANYYREALRLDPDNGDLEAKVAELRQRI